MRIGYQGMIGSNSEEAAKIMVNRLGFNDVEFVPLVTSKNVIGELKRGEIDYGVVAIKNSLGGTVIETFEAIKNEYLELVATEVLPIHHCLFKKDSSINNSELRKVASHIQALNQTKITRSNSFSNLMEEEIEDTAIGAKRLSEGLLTSDTAVICRKNAGEYYHLELVAENIEDDKTNQTEFRMFRMSSIDYHNESKPALIDMIKYGCINESGLGYLSKGIMVFAIIVSFYLAKWLQWSTWEVATFVGGYVSVLFLFLTSKKIRDNVRFNSIKGYWKYYSLPESQSKNGVDQRYETPRVVLIDEVDGELLFKGWICDKENVPLFQSTSTIISSLGKCKGSLVYWYSNPNEMNRGYALNGLVVLNWQSKSPASKINKMSGWYMGKATGETGNIEYLRITKEEFDVHRKSDYL